MAKISGQNSKHSETIGFLVATGAALAFFAIAGYEMAQRHPDASGLVPQDVRQACSTATTPGLHPAPK